MTKKVNFRVVLEAHKNALSWRELNRIIELHNEACSEETYGEHLVAYCHELVQERKVR